MTIDRYDTRSREPRAATYPAPTLRRRPPAARLVLGLLFAVHGLIHLLGFGSGLGLLDLALLPDSVPTALATLWLAAGLLCLASAVLLLTTPRSWWVTGLATVVASQTVIVSAWSLAWAGTLINVVLLVAVLHGAASRGPGSLRAEYERALSAAWPAQQPTVITEAHLVPLPEPVQRYLRRVGVVGQPRVRDFRATWTGRMRSSPDSAWMPFTADQLDIVAPRRRYFKMDATMRGVPVDVLHVFDEHGATMRVRLFSLRSMVDASGPDLTRAETVTLFNDLCLYAPSTLTEPSITWDLIDTHAVRAHFTLGVNTVGAVLRFADSGDLTDFESDDRIATAADGALMPPARWSTPITAYTHFGSVRVPCRADVKWHPSSGTWTYGEFTLTSLSYNTSHPERPGNHHATRHMVPPVSQQR